MDNGTVTGATCAIDLSAGRSHYVTLNYAGTVVFTFSGAEDGAVYTLWIKYLNTSMPDFTSEQTVKYYDDGTPVWSAVNGKTDVVAFQYHAGDTRYIGTLISRHST